MDLLKQYIEFIKKENLFQTKDRLLVAVSGGVDSVVLCELCKQAGYDFVIAHCNFQLRGIESERDEQFVRSLGEKYKVEVLVKKFDTKQYIEATKKGIQEAARDLRYAWFKELNCQWVLTAQHADDNIETVLMNFFKGTGINGLHGILPKQGKIIRPLLFARKDELRQFAEENNLKFVEDSSNDSNKYTRNYFRNKLIPDLQTIFPQVENNLLDNIQRFNEVEELYRQSVELHKKKLLEQKGAEVHIPVLKLLKTEPIATIVYEIIRDFGFTANQTNEVVALLQRETGKYIQSSTHRILKNRNWLIISPNQTSIAANILIEEDDTKIEFANGVLVIKKINNDSFSLNKSSSIAQLDATEIEFPLLLRKWKQGDYFYPLGMNKKKKLSRFFIDRKLSLSQKENVWVVEMDKKIIWIVGLQIDNRFKVTDKTKELLVIDKV
jgi:tRNA(Ile)-lysidine synthase